MEPRISLITLGVTDLRRAMDFYGRMGWEGSSPDGEVAFYQAGGMILGLWDRALLAADTGVTDTAGYGGITLAHNVGSPEEVDAVLAEARAAGGTVLREGGAAEWGGYTGVFADPDGHPWEVAHNPHWRLADDGTISLA
jgi:catechol 2,3-dioxygenase-like lactoylglutathione lyase family enzyme